MSGSAGGWLRLPSGPPGTATRNSRRPQPRPPRGGTRRSQEPGGGCEGASAFWNPPGLAADPAAPPCPHTERAPGLSLRLQGHCGDQCERAGPCRPHPLPGEAFPDPPQPLQGTLPFEVSLQGRPGRCGTGRHPSLHPLVASGACPPLLRQPALPAVCRGGVWEETPAPGLPETTCFVFFPSHELPWGQGPRTATAWGHSRRGRWHILGFQGPSTAAELGREGEAAQGSEEPAGRAEQDKPGPDQLTWGRNVDPSTFLPCFPGHTNLRLRARSCSCQRPCWLVLRGRASLRAACAARGPGDLPL